MTEQDLIELKELNKKFKDKFYPLILQYVSSVLANDRNSLRTLALEIAPGQAILLSAYKTDIDALTENNNDFIKTLESYENGK